MKSRLLLVGYPAEYFLSMAVALEADRFEVYWVVPLLSDVRFLKSAGVSAERILSLDARFVRTVEGWDRSAEYLLRVESPDGPKVYDIIQMDRLLKTKDWRFAVNYLAHVARAVDAFVVANKIELATSWRDTAPQLISMLVCRSRQVPFVVPTRLRIPQEVYGFCSAHHTQSFLQLREPNSSDMVWAERVLEGFESRAVRPALKKSSRSFLDVLRLLPVHVRAFKYEVRRSVADAGNDYARYTLPALVRMYAMRRVNLLLYKLVQPAVRVTPRVSRFGLYALHTQPESSVDVQGSYFSNQVELIRQIARSMPVDCPLFVKVHPTDVDGKSLRFYREIAAIPGVVLLDFSIDSRTLLNEASIVFALTGTIAYEAALARKPVIVFARNFFNELPTVAYCSAPSGLSALISKMTALPLDDRELRPQVLAFLARMRACCFDGEVSRTYGASNERLRKSDLDTIGLAYVAVLGHATRGASERWPS
jgi:hypothetical protein